ncbi:MAG: trypsin-like peptidase domain-containing protein, partial [Clostridia bacterium]|nr:trypsin-like peptidase domain-containing protein [Clostridia bacterium]
FLISVIIILSALVIALVSYIIYSLRGDISNLNGGSKSGNSTISEHVDEFGGESAIKFESKPQNTDEYTAESIYEVLAPSVVGVVVYDSKSDIISDPKGEGSGIIINERGYIVTNSHVVGNSKQSNIKIVFHDGEEVAGKVIGYDSKTDIAVIKAEKTGLKAVTFGNSDEAKVGSSVLALGNPLGLNFAGSLTKGIISAVNRSSNGSPKSLVKYIQTDAAINPGNSGGPLINMYGQVIGVNSAKIALPNCEGMGFAIPSNTVKSIVDDIIAKGYVSGRVRLGLSGKMVSNYQSQMYNVPMGIIVAEISGDSNLKQAGIQVGDIITKINDTTITDFDTFYAELENHSPGNSVKLTVYRSSANRMSSDTFETEVVLLEDKGETQESTVRPTLE